MTSRGGSERESDVMRAVIYARYSSDLQRDASIEDQIRLCQRRVGTEGRSLDRARDGGPDAVDDHARREVHRARHR